MLTFEEAKFIIDGKFKKGATPTDVMQWVDISEFDSQATATGVENYLLSRSGNAHKPKKETIADLNALPMIVVNNRNTKDITADAIVALAKKNNPRPCFGVVHYR